MSSPWLGVKGGSHPASKAGREEVVRLYGEGLTQAEIAVRLGVHRTTVVRWWAEHCRGVSEGYVKRRRTYSRHLMAERRRVLRERRLREWAGLPPSEKGVAVPGVG